MTPLELAKSIRQALTPHDIRLIERYLDRNDEVAGLPDAPQHPVYQLIAAVLQYEHETNASLGQCRDVLLLAVDPTRAWPTQWAAPRMFPAVPIDFRTSCGDPFDNDTTSGW